MIKTLNDAVKFLENYIPNTKYKHPGKIGLERMRYLVKLIGNPQNDYKTIHVGGTSGKGSTAMIIAAILATKYKIGLHTSPHLERVNERFTIFSRAPLAISARSALMRRNDISDDEFVKLVNEIKPAVLKMEKSMLGSPSYFEIITAIAFLYFKKQNVDFAVIEVGMGGTYDATNVIKPEVAVLTNIGLDHTEILGDTVEEIARDKAGIIKRGISVVSGVKQPSVIKIIESRIKNQESRISLLNRDFRYEIKKISDEESYFDYFGNKNYRNIFIPLLGVHQIENAAIVLKTVEELGGFSEEEIRLGFKKAFIPGRLEIVAKNPFIILDGAHNTDKIKALTKAIKTIWPGKKVKLVLAIKEDKKADEMLEIITPISKQVILTTFRSLLDQGTVLSIEPECLKENLLKLKFSGEIIIEKRSKDAFELAKNSARKEDIILVTGSLYLVGKIRVFLNEKQ